MGLVYIDRNKDRILADPVQQVVISFQDDDNGFQEAGLFSDGSIKMTFTPNSTKISDKTNVQLGYEYSIEMKALQFYSLYEYEKLVNEVVMIALRLKSGRSIYIKDVRLNFGGEFTIGNNEAPLTLTAEGWVSKIRDLIDGNPWGELPEPFSTSKSVTVGVGSGSAGIGLDLI